MKPTTYPCGCVNAPHPCGVVTRKLTCSAHTDESARNRGRAYYDRLGAGVDADGYLGAARVTGELEDALGPLPKGFGEALEIGCGASLYAPAVMQAGYTYLGLEPDEWAAEWTRRAFNVPVLASKFPTASLNDRYFSLIVAAHCLEHFDEPPPLQLAAMRKLMQGGAKLVLIVLDDSDPINADHRWFFTDETLDACIESSGLKLVKRAKRRVIDRENFLYRLAVNP